tara:strand:+ start:1477 stop:1818 length:342 start_codon:yes stop_codon:yes gene_type:complete
MANIIKGHTGQFTTTTGIEDTTERVTVARGQVYGLTDFTEPKGSHDLEQKIADLAKQKEILQSACRRAGVEIKELKDTIEKLEKIAALTREDVLGRLRDAENYFKTEDYTEKK